ncbi:hypothetical protein [Streptomyces colonosanans]|uniref:Uncharacterized protein n=1 Tax=Streptomyces colonosanans TaxID=1428652 RepID=A0A1S2NZT7_9ACTN|nr:hypothetical protein [Streptomyces colonosanans]OIJ86796.1 hypothetical protein BIV24_25590 [Streptomyces colonosanans]
MYDRRREEARLAVRQAVQRLTEDAAALTAASAEAREIGLTTRAEDLRRAVLTAWCAGVARGDLAQDARVEIGVIDDWVVRTSPLGS